MPVWSNMVISIKQTPLYNGHFSIVPWLSVNHRFSCICTIRVNHAAMDIVNGIPHIILKLIWSNNLMFPLHCRPINSNNNTLAVFPLPCLRKVLRIDSLFHLTTIFFNQHRVVDILHTLHITAHMMRPVTHFPLSTRPDDENYDVRGILHQCYRESIVRFLIETKVCIINAFKTRSSAFESRQELSRVYQSYRESSQHLWRHFLHYDIIRLKVPFRLTGHI